ncbi:MAG: hypothetical protein SNG69_06650 [Rikenellaceae bacterium]
MENNITEFLEYDDIQELRNNAGREINEYCRTRCEYVESHLSGTAHFDGADYIGTTQSEDLVYKRYKLLDDTVNECQSKLKHWGLEDKLYEQVFQVCYPYIKQLFELYKIAKEEYEIYLQVEGYSSLSVAEVATTEDNARTDLDKLLECCNFKFKNNADNVDRLNELIKNRKNAKDFARVALLLQERKILTSDWNKAIFSKWHKHFCNVSKCKYNANYNPEKLKDNIYETLKSGFLCT